MLVGRMPPRATKTALDLAAERLRAMVLDEPEGALIGNEEALIAKLGSSRSTVRQVARLLEREGLLRVKRGIYGGYFGTRPDTGTIETTVSVYLQTLKLDTRDVMMMASALWIEAVRKAASADTAKINAEITPLKRRVKAIKDHATFEETRELELKIQAAVFRLAQSDYIKLIFDINVAFADRKFTAPIIDDESREHLDFVQAWREAKLLELNTIMLRDTELAAHAARYSRKVWHRRLQRRFAALLGSPAAGG